MLLLSESFKSSLVHPELLLKYTGKKAAITHFFRGLLRHKGGHGSSLCRSSLHPGWSCCPGKKDLFLVRRSVFVTHALLS